MVGCGNGSSISQSFATNSASPRSAADSSYAKSSPPDGLAPTPGQATITFTDTSGFRFIAWVAHVTRPITSAVSGTAPPGKSFLHLDIGLKSLQADRPSPLPTGDYLLNGGRDLPFYLQVPTRDLPGLVVDPKNGTVDCQHYGESGLQIEALADRSGCSMGLKDVGPSASNGTQPPLPPGGSGTVAWESIAVRSDAPLSDFQLATNSAAVSTPKDSELLSLQR
jgi:hypothetical protein